MERTQSFERPEYFGISEEERERAVEVAGLPQDTTREELTEDYFRSWLAQKSAEYPRGKSEEKLKNEFAEVWVNPEFRASQYEARAGITKKISTTHEKNANTQKQTELETEPEKEDNEEEPTVKTSEESGEDTTEDEKPSKMLQKAMNIAKELNIELPEGKQKPGAELFEIKKEIAKRLGIDDIKSFNITDFIDVPANWISDLIRKNDGEMINMSEQQRKWTNEIMEKLYLSQSQADEEQEEIVEEEPAEEPEGDKPEDIKEPDEPEKLDETEEAEEAEEIETSEPEEETESEPSPESYDEKIDAMDASEKWKGNLKVSIIKETGTFNKKTGEFEWAQKALEELGYKFKALGRGSVEGAIITGIVKK